MKNQIFQTEEHHRRDASLGGLNIPSNISYVLPELHRSWHVLFGNLNANQICEKINALPCKPEGVNVICIDLMNGSKVERRGRKQKPKDKPKRLQAWDEMFGKLPFEEAISWISSTWLDPSYYFFIQRKTR